MNENSGDSVSRWWPFGWLRSRRSEQMTGYRRLAMQLHYDLPRPESLRSVLLVTPTAMDLCARGIAALACCVAEELGRPTLLADVSCKHPEVSRLLGCQRCPGLVDLAGDPKRALSDFVIATNRQDLFFLPAGTGSEPLGQPDLQDNVAALLSAAGKQYDFLLLSGGPVLEDSMSLALAPHVGCVLLLVVESKTTVDDLEAAQDAIASCGAPKTGLILTTPLRGKCWPTNGLLKGR